MGLLQLLGLRDKNASEDGFIKGNLDTFIEKDKDLRKYFYSESGERRTDNESQLYASLFEEKTRGRYRTDVADYFNKRGFVKKYVTAGLRLGGLVTNLLGSALFWTAGAPGAGMKYLGLRANLAADAIEGYHFLRYGNKDRKIRNIGSLVSESTAEHALAYTPLFLGELMGYWRGRKKFDNKVVHYALRQAKSDFLKEIGRYEPKPTQEARLLSLSNFQNPAYQVKKVA